MRCPQHLWRTDLFEVHAKRSRVLRVDLKQGVLQVVERGEAFSAPYQATEEPAHAACEACQ